MTWTLSAVSQTEVKQVWSTVAPLLAPAVALSNGRVDMASVFEWLSDRRYILWVAYSTDRIIRAAFVTREARYPRRKMLTIDIAGGSEMRSWVTEADRVFRAYARDVGLDGVELAGRAGWAKALKALGWSGGIVLLETSSAAVGGNDQ